MKLAIIATNTLPQIAFSSFIAFLKYVDSFICSPPWRCHSIDWHLHRGDFIFIIIQL